MIPTILDDSELGGLFGNYADKTVSVVQIAEAPLYNAKMTKVDGFRWFVWNCWDDSDNQGLVWKIVY
ncbi:hypothetical protein COV16_05040 [Candidatus Woesearchaeota archaeon CG10_big_fil_rev_8_21_14_0_10_34_8]|nr:MAG: hypothetical protein COV16_05040 [Candidatus Woesearchaeota archaeon CG10_big_fil_rev_8_21_14_0_10_34_8]